MYSKLISLCLVIFQVNSLTLSVHKHETVSFMILAACRHVQNGVFKSGSVQFCFLKILDGFGLELASVHTVFKICGFGSVFNQNTVIVKYGQRTSAQIVIVAISLKIQ